MKVLPMKQLLEKVSLSRMVSLVLLITGLVLGVFQLLPKAVAPVIAQPLPALLPVADVPTATTAAVLSSESFAASVSAQAVYALDVDSASTLLAKNADALYFPASTAKMMTALVARQKFALQDLLVVTPQATSEGTVIGLIPGSEYSTEDILKGLLVSSGNDAAEVLATNFPEGRAAFVALMNQLAQELHLERTRFANPNGLDDLTQETTARDLSLIAQELLKDDFLKAVVATKSAVLTDQFGQGILVNNTNRLLDIPGHAGIKTGTTVLAGEVLVTQVTIHGHSVIITLMKSDDRYRDMLMIENWLKQAYVWKSASEVGLNSLK